MKTYTYSYQNGLCRGREAGEVPGQIRRRPQTPLTASAEAGKLGRVPGKLRRRPQTPRGLGKCQTSCFKVFDASERLKQVVSRNPRPRKGPNKLFQGIRGLGKAQTSCFKVSDASERPKQVVSRFPTPRGVYGRRRSWPDTRRDPNARTTVGAGVCGRRRILPGTRRDPNACTRVGAYCIRPTKHPARDE